MKSIKKFLALLGSALAVSVLAVPAFAEEVSTTSLTSVATELTSTLATDLVTAVGIVIAALVGFIVLKLGLSKVISIVKSLVGKA